MTELGGINFIKGKKEDFTTCNMVRSTLTTSELATLTAESSYIPHFYPKGQELAPIAKVLTLHSRMHIPNHENGEVLKSTKTQKKVNPFIQPKEHHSVFDLGTSSLQRIITQMREMRRSSTKYAYKPTSTIQKVQKTPDCMPKYSMYLHGKRNSNWEMAKRKQLAEMLAK
jgi:hypothetical protein